MPKRRANGEGNIRKRKDGRWEGRYTVDHDPETGKAIIKNVLGKTQAEVKEKLKKAIEENVGIDYGRAKTYTVGTWLEVWMENYAKIKLRPSTFKTSQGFLKNHIKPQIGGIPLADLTSLDLQRFYKHLLDGGRVDRVEAKKKPKGLAPKTVRNIHQMIGSAYNLAMEQKLVTRNPTQGCALPKVEHKEMKTLTADQLSAFFQEARDSGVYELYYLDLATGLRRGELLGLKWTDVDFDRRVVKVQRAISRQNGKVVEAPLKTKNAYHALPLSADAISVLMHQRRKTGSSEWVFPSPSGGPMSPDSVLHMLQRVLKRAELPRIRFHDLRNYAVPPEDLSARYSALARSLNLSDHGGHLHASGLPRQDEYSQCRSRYSFEYYAQEHMNIHKKVCLRFRAKHVLVLICWQIVGKRKISANTHGTKIFREVAENDKKAKKSLHSQTKAQESLVPPAGIEPARF